MKTNNDFERTAYISGNVALANVYAMADDLEIITDQLDDAGVYAFEGENLDVIIENKISEAIEKNCPDYDLYKAFFDECFERLNAHYPCPSITSDYDQSVIFDAISKGDTE